MCLQPERIDPPDPSKPDYDIRADVWSLGISLVRRGPLLVLHWVYASITVVVTTWHVTCWSLAVLILRLPINIGWVWRISFRGAGRFGEVWWSSEGAVRRSSRFQRRQYPYGRGGLKPDGDSRGSYVSIVTS
jgi:hypothetical protein